MQYFTLSGTLYSTQNKLAEGVQELISGLTNLLIDDKDVLKQKIENEVKALNEKYPRCKPVIPHWFFPGGGTEVLHFGDEYRIANLSIFKVKEGHEAVFTNS